MLVVVVSPLLLLLPREPNLHEDFTDIVAAAKSSSSSRIIAVRDRSFEWSWVAHRL